MPQYPVPRWLPFSRPCFPIALPSGANVERGFTAAEWQRILRTEARGNSLYANPAGALLEWRHLPPAEWSTLDNSKQHVVTARVAHTGPELRYWQQPGWYYFRTTWSLPYGEDVPTAQELEAALRRQGVAYDWRELPEKAMRLTCSPWRSYTKLPVDERSGAIAPEEARNGEGLPAYEGNDLVLYQGSQKVFRADKRDIFAIIARV